MAISPEDGSAQWEAFLQRWPIESLPDLTLEQYTQVIETSGTGDSFTYWLEARTEAVGSIWGGSAFKFGIYQRNNTESKQGAGGRVFGEKYAWYEKYGSNPEDAFLAVKKEIIAVAEAARAGIVEAIVSADLGMAVKWKIAFLYQPVEAPYLLPIYSLDLLRLLAEDGEGDFPSLNQKLLQKRGGEPLFAFAGSLWKRATEIKATHEQALKFLSDRYQSVRPPSDVMAGFFTPSGRQVGLVGRNQEITLIVEPGDWEKLVPEVVVKQRFAKDDGRIGSLKAHAPRLAAGNPAVRLTIPSLPVLAAFCAAYGGDEQEAETGAKALKLESINTASEHKPETCMNKILYGPPGTGKTFKTAALAVELCKGTAEEDRGKLMSDYEQLRRDGQICFVTFHQSYGYEEFVEGLRPEVSAGQVTYRVRPGVFRDICDAARRSQRTQKVLSPKLWNQRKFFKMSLGVAGTAEGQAVFQDAIEKGQLLLGWGDNIDFSMCNSAAEIKATVEQTAGIESPDSQIRYLTVFKEEMAVGDIVIVSQGNKAFRAIGEVSGEYEFLEAPLGGRYHQARRVNWLAVFESNRQVDEVYGANFMQQTLYKLKPDLIKQDVLQGIIDEQAAIGRKEFVLVIDEINRANISKVFGELITLLEPDKREGEVNAITVKLPYSGIDFSVPSNLHIIGTMNTADRSIALLDTALRRRFEFEELAPDATKLGSVQGVDLSKLLVAMNDRIEAIFDRDHLIGHAFFIGVTNLEELETVFRRKVIPLLQEYFYENWANVRRVLNDLGSGDFVRKSELVQPPSDDGETNSDEVRVVYRVITTPFSVAAYQRIYAGR